MTEPKEKTDAEKHEDYEKQREKDGIEIHLPRTPAPVDRKKKPEK